MKMINNEQYENIIELMKIALNFYANESNYFKYREKTENARLFSPIEMDCGAQAKFVLRQVEQTIKENQNISEIYEGVVNKIKNESDKLIDELENEPNDLVDKTKNDANDFMNKLTTLIQLKKS